MPVKKHDYKQCFTSVHALKRIHASHPGLNGVIHFEAYLTEEAKRYIRMGDDAKRVIVENTLDGFLVEFDRENEKKGEIVIAWRDARIAAGLLPLKDGQVAKGGAVNHSPVPTKPTHIEDGQACKHCCQPFVEGFVKKLRQQADEKKDEPERSSVLTAVALRLEELRRDHFDSDMPGLFECYLADEIEGFHRANDDVKREAVEGILTFWRQSLAELGSPPHIDIEPYYKKRLDDFEITLKKTADKGESPLLKNIAAELKKRRKNLSRCEFFVTIDFPDYLSCMIEKYERRGDSEREEIAQTVLDDWEEMADQAYQNWCMDIDRKTHIHQQYIEYILDKFGGSNRIERADQRGSVGIEESAGGEGGAIGTGESLGMDGEPAACLADAEIVAATAITSSSYVAVQAERERFLAKWLAIQEAESSSFDRWRIKKQRLAVWEELSRMSSEFPPSSQDTIYTFFTNQQLCRFRRGRPPGKK